MTPIERAEKAFDDAQRGPFWGTRDDVIRFVADAIRDAVAEERAAERAACARVAREIAVGYLRGPQIEGYGRFADVADRVNQAIMKRST
jgi:hypothetical protein